MDYANKVVCLQTYKFKHLFRERKALKVIVLGVPYRGIP